MATLLLPAALGAFYDDASTICKLGGIAGQVASLAANSARRVSANAVIAQVYGNGWDLFEPLSLAGCVFLTYRGSLTQFPSIFLATETDAELKTGCTGGPATYTRHVWYDSALDRVLMYRGKATNATLFQQSMVALIDWGRDPTDSSAALKVWNAEIAGRAPILPGRACGGSPTDDCGRLAACFADATALATGLAAYDELYENGYRDKPATWLSASSFASASKLGGVSLWCVRDKDCGSDELACREGPPTMPGFCFRLASRPDTDADISQAVSLVVIVVAAVLAVALLVYTGRRRDKTQ